MRLSRIVCHSVIFAACGSLTPSVFGQMVWNKATAKLTPGGRAYHAMAYDSARQRMVVFGGLPVSSDTWEYDGKTWLRRVLKVSPSVRGYHTMVYDAARRVVVLFGGLDFNTPPRILGDTWEYDGVNWRRRQPKASPPPLMGHAMAYDSTRRRVVLFGGGDSTRPTISNQTWEYDGTTWRQRHMVTAPARAHAGMVFDEGRGVFVMTGGVSVAGGTAQQHSTKNPWEWNGSKLGWVQRNPVGPGPFPSWCRMVYDTSRRRTVWCGVRYVGQGSSSHVWESWEWDGRMWRLRLGKIVPRRSWHAVAYDSKRERAILFGGGAGVGTGLSSETWEYYPANRGAATPAGVGCAGSAGTPTLAADGPPILGNQDFQILFGSARADSPLFVALALRPANATVGGCTLLIDPSAPILIAGRSNRNGTLELPLAIPFHTALRGFRLAAQGFVHDPNGRFYAGLAFTNGLRLTIGD